VSNRSHTVTPVDVSISYFALPASGLVNPEDRNCGGPAGSTASA
jgi:hypothetical protein